MNGTILKLMTGSNNYADKTAQFSSTLSGVNKQLIDILKATGVTTLNMTTLGNSIATGYSMSDIIKPLLLRNQALEGSLNENGINVNYYNFSRAQDNNEERLLEWITGNIKQSELNRYNHVDFKGGPNTMERSGITDEEVDNYFPLTPQNDKGLNDLIMEKNDNLGNIIVYTGCTGSFLDNVTRHGHHLNLYGFKRDLIGMESVLKTIYIKNPHTQVYVIGIPNFLNMNITAFINNQIKAICERYSNAIYVTPAPARLFYDKNGKLVVDMHHNQSEYLNLNCNIMTSIVDNYIEKMFNIEMDNFLSETSNRNQFDTPELKNDINFIDKQINLLISKFKPLIEKQGKDFNETLNKFLKYYKERYPYDYFYTPKDETIDAITNKM